MTIYLTPYNALQPTPSHQTNQQPHVHVQITTIRPLCSNFHQMFRLVNMDPVEQNHAVVDVQGDLDALGGVTIPILTTISGTSAGSVVLSTGELLGRQNLQSSRLELTISVKD